MDSARESIVKRRGELVAGSSSLVCGREACLCHWHGVNFGCEESDRLPTDGS